MKDITVEQYIELTRPIIVDVRSPIEFEEGAIPNAVNIPLFTNEERTEIGTIYKKESAAEAKWKAMEIVSPKIPSILNEIKLLMNSGFQPVIQCWRGGMRSGAVAQFLEFAGIPSLRLQGGYRAYRQYILKQIPQLLPEHAIILHGMTGVGKTEILNELSKQGYPVINIEQLASHRGSVFGDIGINQGRTQKDFDAWLYHELKNLKDSPYFIMEAESKRIGRVVQPEALLQIKLRGVHIDVTADLTQRVKRIYREYVFPYENETWFLPKVEEGLSVIEKRMKDKAIVEELKKAANEKNYKVIIEKLLTHYYDPRYDHKTLEYKGSFISIQSNELNQAVAEVIDHTKGFHHKIREAAQGRMS
ncbi:tRNA 2-selenouridine(34) synthase MnmH [Cytobacillus spongiae]|uniref:tRNA 2-selenouridine(34) synthase MnmH n=1 Tax=Cytobacillus spongiae TaxID=2901381 RepID=UPI001F2D3A78|nr:tRNA 2-selenouridine(34) synthase MnmH [Cytobacillus spongiae]UII54321.1 tRNA 2-selenouridine(34) synthase MnmH [Cytobacillus spongiae]